MKLEIIEKKDNPLLSRQEVSGVLTFNSATPSNDDVEAALAKQLNVGKDCIRMKKITTHFGGSKADFLAFVYSSKGELEKIEPAPVKWLEKIEKKEAAAKKKQEEAAKEQAKPAEEAKEKPAEESPKEEKAEEKKEEAPKKEKKEKASEEEKKGDK